MEVVHQAVAKILGSTIDQKLWPMGKVMAKMTRVLMAMVWPTRWQTTQ